MFISNRLNEKRINIKEEALIRTEKCGRCLEDQFIELKKK